MEAAGIEKDEGHPQTARNTMLYARTSASYGVPTETARKCSKRAFGHSMVPILGAVVNRLEGVGACQKDQARRSREGRQRRMPLLDEQGRPVIEYGFTVTTDPLRIELIGRAVMWLQEQGQTK